MIIHQPNIKALYFTTSGYQYPLEFFTIRLSGEELSYQPSIVREACLTGCSNYGKTGGCPPRAPLYENLIKGKDEVWLIACRFWSKYKPVRVAQSKNSAIHWKFQDGILARVMNHLGHKLSLRVGGFFLSTGYCLGCPGRKCNFKLGKNFCRNPEKRTFSMEAVGINVVETVKKHLQLEMYWYSPGRIVVPYMLKCIAFFPKNFNVSDIVMSEMVCCAVNENPKIIPWSTI